MKYSGPTIFELGEIEALKRAVAGFKSVSTTLVPSGDDAAVVQVSDGRFVVTTDTMVENHDFRTDLSSGFDLGFKAVASNVADVAAMGARPIALVVAMVVTKNTTQAWLEDFARGLQSAIDELAPACEVVGGDLAAGEQIVIAVSAHGHLEGREPVLRSGAKPGDVLAIAGTLGRAACGLDLLLHDDTTLADSYSEWVGVQLRPKPPISWAISAASSATSMLDVSDGLSLDASRIAKASKVSVILHSQKLQGHEAVLELAAQSLTSRGQRIYSEREWVLHGGEDHSFLATFPADVKLPEGFRQIGEVVEKREHTVYLDTEELIAKGWDSVSS
ncbi:MAG: thiamine-phosphate kinase [Aquiluna sp.]|nr:thiamine-phosphate kinase [Aquiluna sp.]MCF8546113.1 thiamine-phosphate kinase [Aquiluna sp.]